jgi:hypothetical protein
MIELIKELYLYEIIIIIFLSYVCLLLMTK